MSDNSWDDSNSGYDDEFLEESMDQTPLSPPVPTTTTTATILAGEEDSDSYEDYDDDNYEDEFELEESVDQAPETPQSAVLRPPQAVSSPRVRSTGRGSESNVSPLQPLRNIQSDSVQQYSPNEPPIPRRASYEQDNAAKSRDTKETTIASSIPTTTTTTTRQEPQPIISSLIPEDEIMSTTTDKKSKEVPLFNRDLTETSTENKSEYLSPSTSAAVALMMKRSWNEAAVKKSRGTSEHETDRVLAWLADVAQPKAMSYTSRDENANAINQWAINPTLRQQEQTQVHNSAAPFLPHYSSTRAAFSDPPAAPGTLEENVLEVIFSSLMDELTYPRTTADEDVLFEKEYSRTNVEDRSALESLQRKRNGSNGTNGTNGTTTTAVRTNSNTATPNTFAPSRGYSVPNVGNRTKAEDACEEAYVALVKRACIDHPGRSKDLAKTSGISVELARQVQKELIGVVCDMFTDPQIVATIKTAVMSRVFEGRPLEGNAAGGLRSP